MLQLRGGERELAVLVLAVEGQQRAADVAQVGRRGAAAAEVRARAPLGRTRRASTTSSASGAQRGRPGRARSSGGSANTPST